MADRTVIAIDPGRSKCGLAVVQRNSPTSTEILLRQVVPTEELEAAFLEAIKQHPVDLIIVGGGTQSKPVIKWLRDGHHAPPVMVVDETDSTQHARERYWAHHGRRGWRVLLPASFQVPPEPIDDFAAVVLADRVLLNA